MAMDINISTYPEKWLGDSLCQVARPCRPASPFEKPALLGRTKPGPADSFQVQVLKQNTKSRRKKHETPKKQNVFLLFQTVLCIS